MSWDELRACATAAKDRRIADMLDEGRAADFSATLADGEGELLFDYAKTSMDADARDLILRMIDAAGLDARRDALFSGAPINETEGRAVLHTALRNLDGGPVMVDGADVMVDVRATLGRMEGFAAAVRDGSFTGQGGAITDVVNIGIGGSDLGPAMAVRALAPCHDGPCCHFVSNVDGAAIADTLRRLDPATTLVIVASKTFTTTETMTNARTARAWMGDRVRDPGAQFVALSSAGAAAASFGIAASRTFGFADWVGGRYSVWGPIGLSLMLAIGGDAFRAFLRGGQSMDRHFRNAASRENLPVLLAAVGVWHNQGCGHATRAVLPYEERLGRLPAYLQQLEMESNGKSVSMDGAPLEVNSGPIVWGEPGTNGQHAFYQLIHQGTRVVPCEFMVGAAGQEPGLAHHHVVLVANCLAQSEALMRGRTMDEARALLGDRFSGVELTRQAAHRVFPGNRPSTTLVYPSLTPFVLGQLLALYEHRVFVEGVLLGLNSYDQWGVELGKELAASLEPVVAGVEGTQGRDASTAALVDFVRRHGGG